jgi:hypothetical protein
MPRSLPSVRIAGGEETLSKAQQTFNRQIRQIEKLRDKLRDWETATARYQDVYTRELLPLLDASTGLQIRLIHALHAGREEKGLSPTERSRLAELILDLADAILAEHDDAAVKAIYNAHSDVDYDSQEVAERSSVKQFLEDMFDLDLGDEEFASTDEVFERAQAQFREKQSQSDAERAQAGQARRPRRKSARQIEKEARAEADAQRLSQTLRAIYRKLASALHPDREADPQERARKTELMQRINQAYAKNNLLKLLELQLEVEHIGDSLVSGLDDDKLRHFNVVLKEQIAELKSELVHVHLAFCRRFGVDPFSGAKPETLLRNLQREIFAVQQDNAELEQDLALLARPKGAKAWLRKLRTRARAGRPFPF